MMIEEMGRMIGIALGIMFSIFGLIIGMFIRYEFDEQILEIRHKLIQRLIKIKDNIFKKNDNRK